MSKNTRIGVIMESKGGKKVAQDLDNVAKATERVGKNQTRLGQASASAGRSFAAQSQGLGGVVGVYAAAAANVFALTAAFTALNRAAQFETILRGTDQLANSVGTNANSVVKSLKLVTAGQLSIIEAATQANLALSAGFNIDQIEQLGAVALKASRALGRNLTDSFQRITRGAIKLEPELLDEIGIFTRIEPAVEAYAASINKSASSLTRFEKRQAFVSQVIKDGEAAFRDITDSGESVQEVFEKLVANFSDLAIQAGGLLAKALVPLAKFLDENLGTRLALLGAVGLLVFGRLKTAAASFATEGLKNLSERLSTVADKYAATAKAANKFSSAAAGKGAIEAFRGGGAFLGDDRATGAELKRQIGQGLSTAQAEKAQRTVNTLLDKEKTIRKDLKKQARASTISQENFNTQMRQSVIRTRGLKASATLVTNQLAASGTKAKLLAGGINLASVAATKLATIVGGIFTLFNRFVTILFAAQLVGTLFDVDLIGGITEKYRELTAESRRTADGLKAINDNATRGTPLFDKVTAGVSGTVKELREAEKASREYAGTTEKFLNRNIRELEKRLAALQAGGVSGFLSSNISTALGIEGAEAELVATLTAELRAFEIASNKAKMGLDPLGLAVGTLAEMSDVSSKSLSQAATQGLLKIDQDAKTLTLTIGDTVMIIGRLVDGVIEMDDEMASGSAVAVDFASKLKALQDKLDSGQISADKAGSSYGVLTAQAMKAAEMLEAAGFAGAAEAVREALSKANQETGKIIESVVSLDKFSKDLTKTFSGAFKAVDDAALSGAISSTGEFARTSEQALLNQSNLIAEIVALEGKRGLTTKQQTQLEELKVSAEKAAFGNQLNLLSVLDKQVKATLKRNKALSDQVSNLEMANELNKINLEIAEEQAKLSIEQAKRTQIVKNTEQQNKLITEQNKNLETQADAALEILTLSQDRSQELQKQKDLAVDLANLQINSALALKKAQADRQVSIAETRGIATPEAMSNLRIKAAEAAAAIELEVLEQRKQAAFTENNNQIDAINKRIQILEKEFKVEDQKRKNQESVLLREQRLEVTKAKNAKADIDAQIKILALQGTAAIQTRENAEMSAKLSKVRQLQEIEIEKQKAILTQKRIEADKQIIGEEIKILKGYRELFSALTGVSLAEIQIDPGKINAGEIDKVIANLDKQAGFVERIGEEQTKAAQLAEQATIAGIDAQISKLLIEKEGIDKATVATKEFNKTKLDGLAEERRIAVDALVEKVGLAELEKDTVNQNLILRLEQAGIERETAIASLEYAKEKARYELDYQARMDAANAATQAIVADYVDNGLMKLNDALIDGSITMGMVGDTFKDMIGNMLRDIQKAVFQKTISEPIAGIISSSVGSIFPTGTPIKTSAAGGPVHMAGGGMKRDRVPAMLEPGEFVMRKEAVKQAGVGTMMRMNAAPQQLQSGGQVMQGNATYSVARAMELEAMGLSPAQARSVAQDEANKSKSVGGAFSFSDNVINNMRGAPSTSTPATPSNALKAVQDMLGIGKQSSLQTSGTTQIAGRAGIMNDASSAYSQFVGGSGIAGSVNLKPLERDPKIMEALLGGTKVTGAPSSTASVNQFELQNAITNKAIQDASFDPTGNLADILGADGLRGIPISIIGAMLGLDVPNVFARAPTPASLSARKARAVVRQRTGTQATGFKGSYKPGDVTTSGNFMTETEDGIISGIDPFALDKLGYSGSIAATMGGGMGFRAQGSDVEFGSLRGGISAMLTPGRQSAMTVEEFNAMSREGRMAHSPGLGGDRALSPGQRMQMNIYGAYANTPARDGTPRGFTIPRDPITGKHTFSGTIKSISDSEGVAMGGGDFSGYADSGLTQDDVMAGGFVLASGGLVRKMAAGGAVQSRDRVPALLEPGEFVMRRPAAKAIGGAALNQMNATGKNLTPPNIQVNLNNQGAPKNVQAAAPRIQGDKIIIDMITRDMRNNGPIKKSLRK